MKTSDLKFIIIFNEIILKLKNWKNQKETRWKMKLQKCKISEIEVKKYVEI